MANDGLEVDTLFVGCTRPTTYLGVPFSAFIFELTVVVEAFIFTQNLLMLAWIIPAHGIAYLICLKEPRIFDLMLLWLFTKGRSLVGNFWFWKASTYSPLSIQVGKSKKSASRNLP